MDFLDTNVLVYRFDRDSADKRRQAQRVYIDSVRQGRAMISTQVMQEFYVTLSGKFARSVKPEIVLRATQMLAHLRVVQLTPDLILHAADLHRRHALSFWDALIVQAAIAGGAERILSEDMQHGALIDGMRIENPFLPAT